MKLTPVNRLELIRRLRKLGWSGPFPGGKHPHMVKGAVQLTVPNPHHRKDIGVQLLKVVLEEAGISREEWFSAR